ncbi:MAG: sel1 repeat family protein [Alteromonadales bacterium]|nr:sel1 repeat family protein [Alteromonadales bacterium]
MNLNLTKVFISFNLFVLLNIYSYPLIASDETFYLIKAIDHFNNQNWDSAIRDSSPIAESGSAEAQYFLGKQYSNPNSPLIDMKQAIKWYQKAAQQQHSDAIYELAVLYQLGTGVEKDYVKAAEMLKTAANLNHSQAQFSLGTLYDNGEGVPADTMTAIYWYRQSKRQSAEEAAQEPTKTVMWLLTKHNSFSPHNQKDIYEKLKARAEKGDISAIFPLAESYDYGRGVKPNYPAAIKWYTNAVKNNNYQAGVTLGFLYCRGEGVDKNTAIANKWLKEVSANFECH